MAYLTMPELIEQIDEVRRTPYQKILAEHELLFQTAPGSGHNHQAWRGGYWDHVTEVMNLAVLLYWLLNGLRPLDFSLSEVLEVLFLHDIEKPWRGSLDAEGNFVIHPDLKDKTARKEFRDQKLAEYGIELNARQLNAMRYVEGEFDDYSPSQRRQWPLGAFCHACDNLSARLWPTFPLPGNDPWSGAQRVFDLHPEYRDLYSPYLHKRCPDCGSDGPHQLRNYDMMWGDGEIHCKNCGAYIRDFDRD